MTYEYEIRPHLQSILKRLSKKHEKIYEQILNKIEEVITSSNVEHYKNLRYTMKEKKRVHLGHFILIFKLDKKKNMISFEDFDHHDNIYKRK